jgi:hypothetical protein
LKGKKLKIKIKNNNKNKNNNNNNLKKHWNIFIVKTNTSLTMEFWGCVLLNILTLVQHVDYY